MIESGETRWLFTPRDAVGARATTSSSRSRSSKISPATAIGRAFEVDNFERTDLTPEPERRTLAVHDRALTRRADFTSLRSSPITARSAHPVVEIRCA